MKPIKVKDTRYKPCLSFSYPVRNYHQTGILKKAITEPVNAICALMLMKVSMHI